MCRSRRDCGNLEAVTGSPIAPSTIGAAVAATAAILRRICIHESVCSDPFAAVAATAAILRRVSCRGGRAGRQAAAVAATAAILRRFFIRSLMAAVPWPQSPRLRQS